jgi:glutamine amidotransferase
VIGIIDYGMGNLGSVINALKYLDQDARIIARPENAADCQALTVPGVGSFGDCSSHLSENGFTELIKEWTSSGKPRQIPIIGLPDEIHSLINSVNPFSDR